MKTAKKILLILVFSAIGCADNAYNKEEIKNNEEIKLLVVNFYESLELPQELVELVQKQYEEVSVKFGIESFNSYINDKAVYPTERVQNLIGSDHDRYGISLDSIESIEFKDNEIEVLTTVEYYIYEVGLFLNREKITIDSSKDTLKISEWEDIELLKSELAGYDGLENFGEKDFYNTIGTVPTEKIGVTLSEAESFMLDRCQNIRQNLVRTKTVDFEGTMLYMFMSEAENGMVCISAISEHKLEVISSDCGQYQHKLDEWNSLEAAEEAVEAVEEAAEEELEIIPEILEVVADEVELEEELEIESIETDQEEVIEIIEVEEEESDEILNFAVVENKPVFPGCENEPNEEAKFQCFQLSLMKFTSKNVDYPEMSRQMGVQGRVFVSFVVEKNGKISNVEVARGVDKMLDKSAVDVVGKLPKLKPAKQSGRAVRMSYTVPINFRLQ